jgi:two-component system, NarL family, response regulator LiaR
MRRRRRGEEEMAIRILIVDDHPLVRAGLQLLLRRDPKLEVVGEAADGTQAIEMAHHLQPDVILMELLLPDGDGIPTTATIRQEFPQTQVLILTGILGKTRVVEAMQAGASGYMFKDERPTELRTAIRTVAAGQVHLSPRATTALLDELRAPNHRESLTERGAGGVGPVCSSRDCAQLACD